MRYFVFASEEEYNNLGYLINNHKLFPNPKYGIIITGAGYGNVISSLKDLPKDSKIINIGYAGSNNLEIGSEVYINKCFNYHPKFDCKDDVYKLWIPLTNNKVVDCYSSGDFVLETDIKEPVVFDMELYAICSLGFSEVMSIKHISDNLCREDFDKKMES